MKQGDIYIVVFSSEATSRRMHRPALVVSAEEFNSVCATPIVLPITQGGGAARTRGLAVSLSGTGTRTQGCVRCDQPRALDMQQRVVHFVEEAPAFVVDEVLAKLETVLGLGDP